MHWAEDGTSFVLENRDIASGSLVSKFAPPGLRAFAWNDDDRRMAAITSEGMISIYDAALGTTLATWSGPASSYDLSWQKGADELWLSATGKLYRCDSVTGNVLAEQPIPFDLRYSEPHPNGRLLYGMDSNHHLRSWDTVLKRDDVVSTEPAIRYVLSGDGRVAATESRMGASTLWNALSGERLLTVLGRPVKFDRTGSRFASCNSHSLTTWSVIHSDVFQSIPLRASGGVEVFDVSFTGDSCWMALASQAGIMLYELATGREVSLIQPGTRSVAFVVEEGKELLLSTTVGVHVYERAFDRDRGLCDPPREIATVNEGSGLGSGFATFTSDRRWISFVDGSSRPTVLDRKTDAIRNMTPHVGAHLCSVSPDGRWCLSGTFHGSSVRRWDLSQAVDPSLGTDIWDAQPHSRSGFSPDGKWLVVSATNETRVWDTRTWQVVFRRRRLDASDIAAPATFNPDSRLLVIIDDQTNLPLIDTGT